MKYEILVTPIDILDMPREKNNNKYKKKHRCQKSNKCCSFVSSFLGMKIIIHSLKALSVVGNISQYKRDVIPLPVEKQVKAFTSSSIGIRDGIQLK